MEADLHVCSTWKCAEQMYVWSTAHTIMYISVTTWLQFIKGQLNLRYLRSWCEDLQTYIHVFMLCSHYSTLTFTWLLNPVYESSCMEYRRAEIFNCLVTKYSTMYPFIQKGKCDCYYRSFLYCVCNHYSLGKSCQCWRKRGKNG